MTYDNNFYKSLESSAELGAFKILPLVAQLIKSDICSVIDIGCGTGTWLSVLETLCPGIRFLGVDLEVSTENLKIPEFTYFAKDLTQPFFLGKHDLVISLEVAEHLEADNSAQFIQTLTLHGDIVLFSAAIPGQGGTHHVNEQYPIYWEALFAKHGYAQYDVLRPMLWNDPDIKFWYKQNIMLYLKIDTQKFNSKALRKLRTFSGESLVHPDLFKRFVC